MILYKRLIIKFLLILFNLKNKVNIIYQIFIKILDFKMGLINIKT